MEKLREERASRKREPAVSVAQNQWDALAPFRLGQEQQRQAHERATNCNARPGHEQAIQKRRRG